MNSLETLCYIVDNLLKSNLQVLTEENIKLINEITGAVLKLTQHSDYDIQCMDKILFLSNILWENTDRNKLPLDDGIYDLLIELYRKYNPNFQVGAPSIQFINTNGLDGEKFEMQPLVRFIEQDKLEDMLFANQIVPATKYTKLDILQPMISFADTNYISKRIVNQKQLNPKLVGTLDKCKFVLNAQAIDKGVFNDSNVKVLERDFFQKHIQQGILDPNRIFSMLLELKFDGVSVSAKVSNKVHQAMTRGDANNEVAADITPILYDYKFPRATGIIPENECFDMKFEAIMTYYDLYRYNIARGKNYKNCRTAIISVFGSSDAAKYRDYITLMPITTSLDIDRLSEMEFLDNYYQTGERIRYAVISGTYIEILFQIKKFVEEAEYMRSFIPYMYDGIVASYLDEDLINTLGRENSINKYSMAIKFNPLKKQTIFRGYTYEIGQDGSVTPMIHYDPVEFYGTIHPKSTGHSYERFKTLGLRIGDIIDVEYVNDVMPYVTKPINTHNDNNQNALENFITHCPYCQSQLVISESGRSVYCKNIECSGRHLSRIVGTFDKLDIKDFSEGQLKKINKYTLTELLQLKLEDVEFLGDLTSTKFIQSMNELYHREIYDFNLVGALGFTSVASKTWMLILNKISLQKMIKLYSEDVDQLRNIIVSIKGIGPITADTIVNEFEFFMNDLITICTFPNLIITEGIKLGKKIRFTGFRDKELVTKLASLGYDIGEGSVTKDTDILLIPVSTYSSPKTKKAASYGVNIVPIDEFRADMEQYLA